MSNKTVENENSVHDFIADITDERRKTDAFKSLKLYEEITDLNAVMWGNSIIGFGKYHYKYDSGREGDFFKAGFSPRKTSMTYYIMSGFREYDALLEKLGKHKLGKSCLYVKNLEKIDTAILSKIIRKSFEEMNRKYPDHD